MVVFTLLISISDIGLRANGSMTLQSRLNNPSLNIIEDFIITFIDDAGNPISGDPNINTRARIRINWALFERDINGVITNEYETDLIQPGDTFTFTLPDAFRVANTISNINLSGFGTAQVNTDNTVVLTFNEIVSQSSEIEGFIEFSARLNADEFDGPGVVEIILPIREQSTFTFNLEPTTKDTGVNKLIHAVVASTGGRNPSALTWEVQINKAYATLVNAVVTDALPSSLELSGEANAIEVLPLFLNLDGTLKPLDQRYGTPLIEGVDYSISGTTISFLNTINTPYAIRLKTLIKDNAKPTQGGNLLITNQVSLSSQGLAPIQASATFTANYGRLLSKTRTGYNADTQTFTWRVAYNFGEITLVNPTLVDTFSSNMTYVENSLTIRTESNVLLVQGVDYSVVFDDATNQLTIQFLSTINQAYNIDYQTTLRPEVIVSGSSAVAVSNSVTSEGQTSSASGSATQRVVIKSSNSINYQTREIGWQINLNINRYTMSNMFLTDTYTSLGMEMVSLVVYEVLSDGSLGNPINDNQYILTKTYTDGVETGFTLQFINDLATTNKRFRVDLVTRYDMNNKPTISGIPRNRFRNTATMTWVDENNQPRSDSSSANRDVVVQTVNNGQKSGNYNAISKEITWNIRVNFNNDSLVSPRLVDPILGNQVYVPDSLMIYEYRVNSNGTMTRLGGPLDLSLFTIQYPNASNNFTFVIDFPLSNGSLFEIEFKTSLNDQMIVATYTNTATFTNDNRDYPLTASVSITNGNDLVTKSGVQVGSLIRWSIAINQSQSTIRDAQIEDIPSINQRFVLDSFKLYPTTVATNGTYTINRAQPLVINVDYTIDIISLVDGSQRFILRFLEDISRPYVLEYDSEINTTPSNTTITNSVILSGNGVTYEDQDDDASIVINIESAGGGAVGVQGSLQVRKENPDGAPIQGVVFNLLNRFNRVIGTGTTDVNGVVVFRNLVYGNYTLKEISTVGSYVISDTLFNGLSVSINATSSEPNTFTTVVNRPNQTTLRKVDVNGTILPGAVFRLEFLSSEGWNVINDALSLETGEIILEGLNVGRYRLIETTTISGYLLNTEVKEFEITRNVNQQAQDIVVEFTNYQGSVRLVKEDDQGNRLEGVEFDLINQFDQIIRSNLTTNEQGVIELNDLAPGDYFFVETSSVNGNLINTTPIGFTIVSSSEGRPQAVNVGALNGKANVYFSKINSSNQPLQGSRFALYRVQEDERELMTDTLVSDEEGYVRYEQLSPGRYEFVELEATTGYLVNSQALSFEIPTSSRDVNFTLDLGTFTNYQGSVRLIKQNASEERLSGVRFNLLNMEGEVLLASLFTDDLGVLEINQLAPGQYQLVEIQSVQGYLVNPTPIIFEIEDSALGQPNTQSLFMTNNKASIEFFKVNRFGEPLYNAQFALYQIVEQEKILISDMIMSNEEGFVRVDELSVGSYELVELNAPEGHVLNTQVIRFDIPESSEEEEYVLSLEDVINYKGSVQLLKTDVDGRPLNGVVFQLLDELGQVVLDNLMSDELGLVLVDELAPGVYQFVEISSVGGNLVNSTPVVFTIAASFEGEPETVNVTTLNGKATVEFKKVDQNKQPLENVLFALYAWINDERILINDSIASDEFGVVRYEGLIPGSYEFEEVMTKSGYILNTQLIEFSIPEVADSENYVLTLDDFINYQGSIRLVKVNTLGNVIKEAVFEVYFNNLLIDTLTTVEGMIELNGLAPGTYTFIEVEAPEDYILDDTPFNVVIESSAEGVVEVIEVRVLNEGGDLLGEDDEIPETGDHATWIPLFLLVSGLFLSFRKRTYQA